MNEDYNDRPFSTSSPTIPQVPTVETASIAERPSDVALAGRTISTCISHASLIVDSLMTKISRYGKKTQLNSNSRPCKYCHPSHKQNEGIKRTKNSRSLGDQDPCTNNTSVWLSEKSSLSPEMTFLYSTDGKESHQNHVFTAKQSQPSSCRPRKTKLTPVGWFPSYPSEYPVKRQR